MSEYHNIALINRVYGIDALKQEHELEWRDWICMLATALDIEESELFTRYMMAGGKSEDFEWSHYDLAKRHDGRKWKIGGNTSSRTHLTSEVPDKIKQMFGTTREGGMVKGDVETALGIMEKMGLVTRIPTTEDS